MTEDITPEEQGFLDGMSAYDAVDSGYMKEQSTKPQTVGYALDDSPAGLAAWIVEKFRTWSDCDGDVERSFTKDQLLDNLMVYWVTATAHSSGRLYYEVMQGFATGGIDPLAKPTQPVGYARYPKEIMRTSERWFGMQYPLAPLRRDGPRRSLRRVRVPRSVRARRAGVLPSAPERADRALRRRSRPDRVRGVDERTTAHARRTRRLARAARAGRGGTVAPRRAAARASRGRAGRPHRHRVGRHRGRSCAGTTRARTASRGPGGGLPPRRRDDPRFGGDVRPARRRATSPARGCRSSRSTTGSRPSTRTPRRSRTASPACSGWSSTPTSCGVDPAAGRGHGRQRRRRARRRRRAPRRDRGVAVARQILVYPMLDDRTTTPDPELAPFAAWSYDDNYTGWHALLGDAVGGPDVSAYAAPARADRRVRSPADVHRHRRARHLPRRVRRVRAPHRARPARRSSSTCTPGARTASTACRSRSPSAPSPIASGCCAGL